MPGMTHVSTVSLQDWLSKFGYLPPPDPVTGQLQTKEALTKAIKAMQKFGGLEETGVFDQATLGLMKTPRCSLPDVSEADATMGRRKRSLTPQNKWNKRHLSWRVRTFPKDSALLGRDTVRALMYYALKVWSDIAPLNFHETLMGWICLRLQSMSSVHAIGLVHTSAIESIMRPYYQGPVGDPLKYDLPYEDKVRVWQLYGVRDSVSHTNRPGNPSQTAEPPVFLDLPENRSSVLLARDAPDRCTSHFDAVAQIRGEAFFFKGKYFWRLTREKHLVSLRPAQIHRFWRGLPTNLDSVDAVYERPGDHKIVFFKGLKYWVFKDNIVEEGYPRPISDFGLPSEGVDAAFVWLHNDKTYFFKDNSYWRYDDHLRRMDLGYPKDSALWKGLPSQLDDAMRWSDGSSYFFKGKEYWRVPGSDMEVEAGYPRLIAKDWLLCTEMQSDSPDTEPKSTETRGNAHHHPDHAENGYEVCSCTSDSASPLGARPSPSPMWLLPPLWTLSLALRSELL
ncbi:Matrix metalloproteinase-17 [Collichthys lucidus]|uniref:Matrix metalloproteinase-17 n=1 Tax=Collichthys lucidus TaxID=240159 RepID=A0A4U5V9Y0_COLLU|nr:Matrix metalloproteinase-17 [Collichthys lucidus]